MLSLGWPADAQAKMCDASFYEKLRSAPHGKDDRITVDCDLQLRPDDVITRKLVFAGEAASGVSLDCRGATLGSAKMKYGCLGPNGEAEEVRKSSLNRDHTANAQRNAPSGIDLKNVSIEAVGTIPLYFGPGVTKSSLTNSTIRGKSAKTVIYLDAESAENVIADNRFSVKAGREVIAVDGSARNVISGNEFKNAEKGGIFVYRNCGEGGTIRHQEPRSNQIVDNRFVYRSSIVAYPAIWLNHRDVGKWYCKIDPRYPFGSSLDPRDRAIDNVLAGNRFEGAISPMVLNTERK